MLLARLPLSETFRRWLPLLEPDRESMAEPDAEVSMGVSGVGVRVSILPDLGDARHSSGMPETGVGRVDVVMDE